MDSPGLCRVSNSTDVVSFSALLAENWATNRSAKSEKFVIDRGGMLLNQALAVFFNVVGNSLHLSGSSTRNTRILVLKEAKCSVESPLPSWDSNLREFNASGTRRVAMASEKG